MKRTIFFLIGILIVSGTNFNCKNPDQQLKNQIREALSDGSGISATEWALLKEIIEEDEKLKNSYPDDNAIQELILKTSQPLCERNRDPISCPPSIEKPEETPITPTIGSVTLFLENSASMDGYFDGVSNCKDALLKIVTLTNGKKTPLKFALVNREVQVIQTDIPQFVGSLSSNTLRENGKKSSTEINQVLENVIASIKGKTNELAIVVSDFIYSVNGSNLNDELSKQQSLTTLALQKFDLKNSGVLIIKLDSQFNGLFYDCKHPTSGYKIPDETRPVYFWVLGESNSLRSFADEYRILELPGYENHFFLKSSDNTIPYFSVLPETDQKGRFKRVSKNEKVVTSITGIEESRDEFLQFSIGVDFHNLSVGEQYYTNPENFEVTSDVNDKFEITDVKPILDAHPNSKDFKGTATHYLIVKSEGKVSKGGQTLEVCLKEQLPQWVSESSTGDDTSPDKRKGKTFGFENLVRGVADAYGLHTNSKHFCLSITLNK